MPQVMIGLHVRDHQTMSQVWRDAKRALNPETRRRMGLRGRSSLLREFMLYGFETASKDPDAFLRSVRDQSDPLFGRKGRKDTATQARQQLLAQWDAYFPKREASEGPRKRGRPKGS